MIFMLQFEWISFALSHLPPTKQLEDIDLRKTHDVQAIIHSPPNERVVTIDLRTRQTSESYRYMNKDMPHLTSIHDDTENRREGRGGPEPTVIYQQSGYCSAVQSHSACVVPGRNSGCVLDWVVL